MVAVEKKTIGSSIPFRNPFRNLMRLLMNTQRSQKTSRAQIWLVIATSTNRFQNGWCKSKRLGPGALFRAHWNPGPAFTYICNPTICRRIRSKLLLLYPNPFLPGGWVGHIWDWPMHMLFLLTTGIRGVWLADNTCVLLMIITHYKTWRSVRAVQYTPLVSQTSR